ncbi:MAG: ethanolamine ammonia-lyase subunit EutC [Proteobacteria bacterium]|nr:ethanolamine ammonia-lyase subunit EutC [Pseudomonadota bacterium]
MSKLPVNDPWARLRGFTKARIGLGRAGDAPPLESLLEFQLAHARARDAVHLPFDTDAIKDVLEDLNPIVVASQADDRATYLRRPDLGRRLASEDAARLTAGRWDAAFVIADGLSATAVMAHAAPVLRAVLPKLKGWSVAPPVIASQARVALGDDIGERLNAVMVAILIGERPGLSAADSLGIYLTWQPKIGRQDSERNCLSSIHPPDGMLYEDAAARFAWLMHEGRARRLTGIALKDEGAALALR